MKKYNAYIKGAAIAALFAQLLTASSCTKNFEEYNTNENGITDAQLVPDNNSIGSFFPSMQYAIGANDPSTSSELVGAFEYLINGAFSGHVMSPLPGSFDFNYNFIVGWEPFSMFNYAYSAVMSQVTNIKRVGGDNLDPDFWAIAKIIQIQAMHRITDCYGGVPYSKFGTGGATVPYDKQQDVYNKFFLELDTAVNALKTYIAEKPGATPFKKFDLLYGGDYSKWLKYANSLRLRLAMHIVKADAARAQLEAEKAVDPANGGVMAANSDNARVPSGHNALWVVDHSWANLTAGAAIITYMNGYSDPRLPVYFLPSKVSPGEFIGIRAGASFDDYGKMLEFSHISNVTFPSNGQSLIMCAAEVYFLRAEGALRGWDMGGQTAQELYESGILTSLQQWNVAGGAAEYIANGSGTPQDYVDPVNPINNSPALSSVTVQWDDLASNEEKLEKIITQKWIGLFPNVTEAWTNFRRTGYPKLLPVVVNNSGGTIDTDIQIRRLRYLQSEYTTNGAEVQKAVTDLGGPDTGGTRLWWDIDKGNFD